MAKSAVLPGSRSESDSQSPLHSFLRLAALLLLSGCAQPGYRVERDVVYSPRDWPAVLAADLYVPHSEGLRPAVLVVHGGGWKGGKRGDMDDEIPF